MAIAPDVELVKPTTSGVVVLTHAGIRSELNKEIAHGERRNLDIRFQKVLIALGKPFIGVAHPKGYRKRMIGRCFQNALELSWKGQGSYVEGYACSPGLPPTHHAWVTTNGTDAIDVTWTDPTQCTYLGIPFSADLIGYWWPAITKDRNGLTGPMLDWEAPALLDHFVQEIQEAS